MRQTGREERIIIAVALAVAILQTGGCRKNAGLPASRLYEPAGRFSYVTPDGWTRRRVAGIKYHMVAGPEENGTAPSLYIMDEDTPEGLDSYIPAFVARQKKIYPDIIVGAERTLITEEGTTVHVVEATRIARGTPLTLRLFFLRRDPQTIVVTGTWRKEDQNSLSEVFDEVLRTFRFEK
jgi:hypothetical protein